MSSTLRAPSLEGPASRRYAGTTFSTHVFVEAYGIDGLELSGLPSYFARAMPLFGKLTHFGRVAVVADQAWVRVGTRIESALLPFISYRTFAPDQRDDALAWVEGKRTI